MTIEEINNMSRADLISAEVEAGVAKWGEGERAGLEEMKSAMKDAELRAKVAAREGVYGKIKGDRVVDARFGLEGNS